VYTTSININLQGSSPPSIISILSTSQFRPIWSSAWLGIHKTGVMSLENIWKYGPVKSDYEFIIISKISRSWTSGCNAMKSDSWVAQRDLLLCCQDGKVAVPPKYWYPTPKSIFRVENSYVPKRWKQLLPLNCWCSSTKLHPIWSHKATIWYTPQSELHISHSRIPFCCFWEVWKFGLPFSLVKYHVSW
jgi:hypothetical protein